MIDKAEEAANLFLIEVLAQIGTFSDTYNTYNSTRALGVRKSPTGWVVSIDAPNGSDNYASYVNGRSGVCSKHAILHYHYVEDTLDRTLRIINGGGKVNGI
jgi:hypothetical protein